MEIFAEINLVRWLLATAVIALLMGGFALAVQYFSQRKFSLKNPVHRRMYITDKLFLDARHKIFIVQVDGREHTLLLGPNNTLQLNTTATATAKKDPADA